MRNDTVLQIKNLNLFYDKKQILKEFDLTLKNNSILAISGPSGIGKSSLLLTINQLIREFENSAFSGSILFYDQGKELDIANMPNSNLPYLRRKIVYVSQHPDILPFSIYENIYFPLKLQKIKKSVADELIQDALKRVFLYDEVKDRLNDSAYLLSGGQQQRLILARALVLKPTILLLDEPTTSLNEELAQKIENLLIELKNECSIVMISHFKSQILKVADFVVKIG